MAETQPAPIGKIFEILHQEIAQLSLENRGEFLKEWRPLEKKLSEKLKELRLQALEGEKAAFVQRLRKQSPGGRVYYVGNQRELLGKSGILKRVKRKFAEVVIDDTTWDIVISHLSLEPDTKVRMNLQRTITNLNP